MDSAYINQHQIIERYVRDALAPDERDAFELYMFDHPEVAEEVEYARGLQAALVSARDAFFTAEPKIEPTRRGWFRRPYAVAASVLLSATVLSSVYLLQRNSALEAEVASLRSPVAVSREVWLETLRGAQDMVIEKGRDESILLRVAVDPGTQGPYDVEIRRANNLLWTRAGIALDEQDSLRIVATNLPPGSYELTVVSARPSRSARSYAFELVD